MVKEEFIQSLIRELNKENESRIANDKSPLDVCYMVSVVDQQLEQCLEFMDELKTKKWKIGNYEEDTTEGYTNGKISIFVSKPDYKQGNENYYYCIEFLYDERNWGYCFCEAHSHLYDEEHNCCGLECDWIAPSFRITKETYMGYQKWEGFQRDYWGYEKVFKANQGNVNKEVQEHQKQQRKNSILEEMKRLQEELAKLEN